MKKIFLFLIIGFVFACSVNESFASVSLRYLPNGRKELTFTGKEVESADRKTSDCEGNAGHCKTITMDNLVANPGDVVDIWRPEVGIGKLRVTLVRPINYDLGLTVLEYNDNPAYPQVFTNYNAWKIAMEALQP